MNTNLAKTISTIAVWVSTAALFIGGVFRFSWNGFLAGGIWAIVAIILAMAPAIATQAIWNGAAARRSEEDGGNGPPQR